MESYIRNCLIKPRPDAPADEVMFVQTVAGDVLARLDGYAIIPMDEYERLTAADSLDENAGIPTG